MLEWLLNFGTGVPAWVDFAAIGIVVLLGAWVTFAVISLLQDKDNWKLRWKPIAFRSVILIIYSLFAFAAFGPGTPAPVLDSDIGVMELVDEAPPQKSIEQINEDAYESKDEFLKKQDQGFEEEQAEADAYLENLRNKHQNN
jgi:hypothetical protein